MKWVNHIIVGGSTAAVIDPTIVPYAIFGSILPDLAERFLPVSKHRMETHYLVVWAAAFVFSMFIFDYKGVLLGITYGGLTHIVVDSLSVSGVPFSPWSTNKFHLFGGRLRLGSPAEYIISMSVLVISCLLVYNTSSMRGFTPFFFNYKEFYEEGIVDGHEWRANRFRIF
jgi:inner membrane protein